MNVPTTDSTSGVTRRNVLRRGGLAAGSMIWAVPAIQLINLNAASADVSSAHAHNLPSNFEIIVTLTADLGTIPAGTYGLKFENGGVWVSASTDSSATCLASTTYLTNADLVTYFNANVLPGTTVTADGKDAYIVQIPAQFTVVEAKSKKGSGTDACSPAVWVDDNDPATPTTVIFVGA